MNGIFEQQSQKIDHLESGRQNHSIRRVNECESESIVSLPHTQSNNSACVVGSDDELSSSSEFVLKFSCSSGDKSYEPRLVTRKRIKKRSDGSKAKHVAEHSEPRIQDQVRSYATYSIEEKTEVDTNTPSTTILIWSDEESGCSVQSKSLVLDINMSQNMTKKDLVTKRPYTPCELVSKHLRRNRAFLNTNGSARRYHSQDSSCSKASSSSSPDSINLITEKKVLPEFYSSELNTDSVKPISFRDKTNKIRSLMSELQARRLSDGKEMIIGDSRKVLGMLERLKTVEFAGTCPSSRSNLWPIPKECPPAEEVRDIREMNDFSVLEEIYNVYSLVAICTARCQLPTYIASGSTWNSSRELPSEAVQLDLPNVDECTFDTANPNISSPVVEADVIYPAVRPMSNDHSEIGTQMGLIMGDGSLKAADSKGITNELLNASRNQSTRAANELGAGEPAPAVAASRKKFRRRVKISLHQCPMPSELEAPSLVVRLRIDPLSDSEAVSSKTQCQKVEGCAKEIIKPGKMEMKYDALERRKVSSWMPINYMRSVDMTPDIRLDERERFTGMAECLITSLSSLSIPVSEVESIDTSFSWSLPEPNSQQSKSARQASVAPDAVLVEVLSEEDNSRKSVSPEKSGSEVYCIGQGSPKTPSILSSQLESKSSQGISSTEATRMPKDTKSGDVCKCEKLAGDSPVVDVKQPEQESLPNHHERRPHYRIEKGVSAARPVAKVIRTKTVMYGMRASNVQSSKAAVNEVTEGQDTDSVRGDEAPYYAAYRPTEYEKGDEVMNFTLPYPEAQLPNHSATAVTQMPGLDEDNELSYWAVEFNPREAEKIQCTGAWGERQNKPKMLISRRSQCDEIEIKAALSAIATTNIQPSIRTEVAATQTKKLDTAEPRKVKRKPPRLSSTGLIWKVNTAGAKSQRMQQSIDAEKVNTLSHISSVDAYSRGLFHKKKPLFRSGEMTISEFEELKQKIGESPLDTKEVRKSEKITPDKPISLTSIASDLEYAQPVDYESGDVCGKLNFCVPTGYANVRNQELVTRQTHPRNALDDRHRKARFGFPCAPPGPLPKDGVMYSKVPFIRWWARRLSLERGRPILCSVADTLKYKQST
ncbi:unnamed protein product [Calicophoron daubneyi]|uniref:Uncharacterized protein n=1 Tax=Calicophoron daubneyi TaxID=300641 RepID=A0AAV2TX74_CALDB